MKIWQSICFSYKIFFSLYFFVFYLHIEEGNRIMKSIRDRITVDGRCVYERI